jgi:hypothetical protein
VARARVEAPRRREVEVGAAHRRLLVRRSAGTGSP